MCFLLLHQLLLLGPVTGYSLVSFAARRRCLSFHISTDFCNFLDEIGKIIVFDCHCEFFETTTTSCSLCR